MVEGTIRDRVTVLEELVQNLRDRAEAIEATLATDVGYDADARRVMTKPQPETRR